MSKICPKCNKEIDENSTVCPFCENDLVNSNNVSDIVEVEPIPEPQNINSVSDNVASEGEKSNRVEPVSPIAVQNIDFGPQESVIKSEANETSDTVVTNNNILQEINNNEIESVSVENADLETISVSSDEKLTEEDSDEDVPIPEMPAPNIGELSVDSLVDRYNQEEKENDARRIEKRRLDEERLKRELEMSENVIKEKPDLLAVDNTEVEAENLTPEYDDFDGDKKSKLKKKLNIITIVVILIIILIALLYLFFKNKEEAKDNYMAPIETYFKGYQDGNATTILSSYIPCLAQSDDLINVINNTVNNRLEYPNFKVEYEEVNTEVVNNDDREALKGYVSDICLNNVPEISDYKHVYIKEKIYTTNDGKYEETNQELYTVKIDDKWYLLGFQDE